jgi:hypothetical protein
MAISVETGTITTQVPARLDRLPWSRTYTAAVVAVGVVFGQR